MRWLCILLGCLVLGTRPTQPALASRSPEAHRIVAPDIEPDRVGNVEGNQALPRQALQDTIWIVHWSGDGSAGCDDTGWSHEDGRVPNDGSLFWHVESGFSTSTGMSGNAAALGYHDDCRCKLPSGYDNDWYQGIRIEYTGAATLSFDFILDTEEGFDFLQIETDSACASYERVDYVLAPWKVAAEFRHILSASRASGLVQDGERNGLQLPDHGSGTHCAYVAFFSDAGFAPCDSLQPTTIGEALLLDNIVVVDASGTRREDFEDGTLDLGTFVNMHDREPFGNWARLYPHVTDNDACTENTTCAWLWTDHTTPTLANDPSMAFGPGGYVVRNWLDDILISPWVSLASSPGAMGTILRFRRFPGNFFSGGRFVQSWSVRGRDARGCVSEWGHRFNHNSLSTFRWITITADMTAYFDPASEAIQIRHRVVDRQWLVGSLPPVPFRPGPGPYIDDTRIGRVFLQGPVISEGGDSRSQAQDAFPTELHPGIPPSTGEHHRPTTDRYGSCAFSQGHTGPDGGFVAQHLVTGDSIWVRVTDARRAGGITSVQLHGAIVRGPHAGKAPPPYTVNAQGFFVVHADSVRSPTTGQVRPDDYFVDLDDTYFRGGDELLYFWMATDAQGGVSSAPAGLTAVPTSMAAAEAATGGLFEVSFLPRIHWSADYRSRIAADSHGDLDPTPAEIAASPQATCILYVNHIVARRLSGALNRTSFMYALDRLGYARTYDVYDHQGMGSTNNHLGSRASVEQARGYALIVYDAGNRPAGTPILPDGGSPLERVDQAGWFRDWLAQAASSDAGVATLWLMGSNIVEEKPGTPLLSQDMGVQLQSPGQTLNANPDVQGIASFTFQRAAGTATLDFRADRFALSGGCPTLRSYDHLATSNATAVVTHVFIDPLRQQPADATIIMNRDAVLRTNTVLQSHAWFDLRDAAGTPASAELNLLAAVLGGVLPPACSPGDPVGTGPLPEIDVPQRTTLHGNVPNPLNPMTTIHFDLARSGHVSLRIYDVGGRLVRRLVAGQRSAGRDLQVVWDGMDDHRRPVPSGVYLCRLDADGTRQTRKMLVLR